MYAVPVNILCHDFIKHEILNYMQSFNEKDLYVMKVNLSNEAHIALNSELLPLGFPPVYSGLVFKKRNTNPMSYSECHVDLLNDDALCYTSLIFPIQNCDNSPMYWYDGDYELINHVSKNNVPLYRIKWKSPGKLLHSVNLGDQPWLCKVNIPHGVHSVDDHYRITCTFRFFGNPDYETCVARFKEHRKI
jgi:hypothetical protein